MKHKNKFNQGSHSYKSDFVHAVNDLTKLVNKWSKKEIKSNEAIYAMLLVASDLAFEQFSSPETAMRIVLVALNNSIESQVDDEEFKAQFHCFFKQDTELH